MPGGGLAEVEFADEQREGSADQDDPAESREAIERTLKRRLQLKELTEFCLGVLSGVGGREAMDGEIVGDGMKRLAVVCVAVRNVRDEDGLVVLRPPREHRGDKSYAEAGALISEEIREA